VYALGRKDSQGSQQDSQALRKSQQTAPPTNILSLSTDILQDIFRLSMAAEDAQGILGDGKFEIQDNTKVLLKLGAICYLLRKAIREDKLAWTNIHCDMKLDLVKLYLQLSRPLLVSVRFFGRHVDKRPRPFNHVRRRNKPVVYVPVPESVVSTAIHILTHANRIGCLTLRFPSSSVILEGFMSALENLRPELSYLKTLNFFNPELDSSSELGKLEKLLLAKGPMKLKSFRLFNAGDNLLPLIDITWPLRRLHLSTSDSNTLMEDFRHLLPHLANTLQEFSYTTSSYHALFSPGPLVHMPYLRYVHVLSPSLESSVDFLSQLSFPSAADVQIQLGTYDVNNNSWILAAKYLNQHHRHLPSHKFAFRYIGHFFVFEVMDSDGSFSIEHTTYDFHTNDEIPSVACVAIENLIRTLSDDLLSRVVDVHIRQDYQPWRIAAEGSRSETFLPWTAIIHHFQNISSCTIDAGTGAVSYNHVQLSVLDYETEKFYEQNMAYARPMHSTFLTILNRDVACKSLPHLETLRIQGHRLLEVHGEGEQALLMFIGHRSQLKPIYNIKLNNQCAMSASFRRALAAISPQTVVDMEGDIVPVPSEDDQWIKRGSSIIRDSYAIYHAQVCTSDSESGSKH
jgi:hypothetical protein